MKRLTLSLAIVSLFITRIYAQIVPSFSADNIMNRASGKDTTYIINFWATWCGPCVAELPQFTLLQHRFAKEKVKVLLVSFDFPDSYPDKLTAYVRKKKLEPEVVWFNESNANVFIPKIDTNWSGSLPGTLIINKSRNYKVFLERPVTAKEVEKLIAQIKG